MTVFSTKKRRRFHNHRPDAYERKSLHIIVFPQQAHLARQAPEKEERQERDCHRHVEAQAVEAGATLGAGHSHLPIDIERVRLHGDIGPEAVALEQQLEGDIAVLEQDGVA